MKEFLLKRVKNIWDLEITQNENFDFRFGVFWLTTSKQNAWLEFPAFYKRKLSRATHAAQLLKKLFGECQKHVKKNTWRKHLITLSFNDHHPK